MSHINCLQKVLGENPEGKLPSLLLHLDQPGEGSHLLTTPHQSWSFHSFFSLLSLKLPVKLPNGLSGGTIFLHVEEHMVPLKNLLGSFKKEGERE